MFKTTRCLVNSTFHKFGYQLWENYSLDTFCSKQTNLDQIVTQSTYGQPVPSTHPHLLKNGEIIPGFQLDEFKKRRAKLVETMIQKGYAKNSNEIVIMPSSSKVYMSDKIPYVFRQNTDFLYFTGCQEPDSVLVIVIAGQKFASTLFVGEKDEHSELWDGPRTGVQAAPNIFGVDQALPTTEFDKFFSSSINESKKSTIWYDQATIVQPDFHKKLYKLIQTIDNPAIATPKSLIHQVRLIKSQAEINVMRESCKIASQAINKTISMSKSGMSEHELFAIVDYECRMNGAEFLAYPPVVAAGKNANIIHYISNNQIIQPGDLILMDAGCQYHGYSSDITRTWPIDGKFNSEQQTLYDIILDVQTELIKNLNSMPSLDSLFKDMCRLLGSRLQNIGLIPKNLNDEQLITAAYSYCPHHVGHYLGMDVHDTGKISRNINIQPGMIITVEPGIYINSKNPLAPKHLHGIGIRIEDDVLVTENGPEVLTQTCMKNISDIETLASQKQCLS